jgi:hypothetical protein
VQGAVGSTHPPEPQSSAPLRPVWRASIHSPRSAIEFKECRGTTLPSHTQPWDCQITSPPLGEQRRVTSVRMARTAFSGSYTTHVPSRDSLTSPLPPRRLASGGLRFLSASCLAELGLSPSFQYRYPLYVDRNRRGRNIWFSLCPSSDDRFGAECRGKTSGSRKPPHGRTRLGGCGREFLSRAIFSFHPCR